MAVKFLDEAVNKKLVVGDILQMSYGSFLKPLGTQLVNTHHMFVIVKTSPYTVCEVSSQTSKVSGKFAWNVPLTDWKLEGLKRPSHIKTDTSGVITDTDAYKYVGTLTPNDLKSVLSAYGKAPQNYILEGLE